MALTETSRKGGQHGLKIVLAAFVWRRPWLRSMLLLSPPLAWFLAFYLAALVALFVSAFWQVDGFTGEIQENWTFDNFRAVFGDETYRRIGLRTIGVAAAVTLTDAVLAFPFAYFMAQFAGSRLRAALMTAVMLPLWSSYLARVYAWRLILAHDGALNWLLTTIGLPEVSVG